MPFKLKLLTYLVPDLPLELFQTYQYYLEESLGIPTSLCVESRYEGPAPNRNPILDGEADIVFMSSSSMLQMMNLKDQTGMEVLPVGAVHNHPNTAQRPIYFSELIIQNNRKEIYKEIKDLKGSRYAYDYEGSIAGNLPVLAELKSLGYNATFFGHTLESGSHRKSIQMILQGRADVAAVSSVVLDLYLKERPDHREELATVTSLGPLPIYPVVVNTKLPGDMKKKLTDLFLQMHTKEKWNQELQKLNILGFKPTDMSLYASESAIRDTCKGLSTQPAYY